LSLIDREIKHAWNVLYDLDMRQAAAVDARSELDLRIGAVFTRFQTVRLKNKFAELQDSKVISYGSCQFPTLGFVVDRYQQAKNFKSEDFYKIELEIKKDGANCNFNWSRGHLFDQHCVFVLYELCVENPICTVSSVVSKPTSKWAPLPLTTIEMQKIGVSRLHMTSDKIMHIAEKLYNQGIISYPRTETDSFDDKFELRPLIQAQAQDQRWGPYAQALLDGKFKKPRKGKNNDQAHSPIHPVRAADNLEGDDKKLYEFITRRFLACCSEAAKGHSTQVKINIAHETFNGNGLTILERNYLDVYPFEQWNNALLPNFTVGQQFEPSRLEMTSGKTTAPQMLTEADLISMMDKNGIGTDATIHEHIKKIIEREYVTKQGQYFYPTTLGMALVKGYDEMDMNLSLSKPFLRSQMEANMKLICTGQRQKEEVVSESINMYRDAFLTAREQVNILEASCAKYLECEPDEDAVRRQRQDIRQGNNQPMQEIRNRNENHQNQDYQGPICKCQLPSIERAVRKEGENFGRQFFVCSKKQDDQSRCDLFEVFEIYNWMIVERGTCKQDQGESKYRFKSNLSMRSA
jgi:DNA topoisomerase-3